MGAGFMSSAVVHFKYTLGAFYISADGVDWHRTRYTKRMPPREWALRKLGL